MRNIFIQSTDLQFNNISGIIFDKDGTLTDSHFYWAEIIRRRTCAIQKHFDIDNKYFSSIAKSMGLDIKTNSLMINGPIAIKSRQVVIKSVIKNIAKLEVNTTTKDISDIFKKVHRDFKINALDYVRPISEACEFVKQCHSKNISLALITSDTRTNAEIAIRKIGLDKIFDLVIGVDDGFGDKSTGLPARYACEKMGLTFDKVISIGDAPMDYKMALNSGLQGSILVETGQIPINNLLKISPYCVKSLSEINII
tara:strand:+ start:2118 stop:2879 length:762 start_codon:yes stop_codon:yes gene_type:complete